MEPVYLPPTGLSPAPGRLLVAAPGLADPNFAHTLVLLIEVNDEGALGVVLNRPAEMGVAEAVETAPVADPAVLFVGGPVGTDTLLGVAYVNGDPALVDLDEAWAHAGRFRLFAGYSGWGAEQLEHEIDEGSWYVVPGGERDLLDADPHKLWHKVLSRQRGATQWLATKPRDPEHN